MESSTRCIQRYSNPKYINLGLETLENLNHYVFNVPNSDHFIKIYFNFNENRGGLVFKKLFYETNIEGDPLALIDSIFEFMQDKHVGALLDLSVREIDYFLRDKNSVSSFSVNLSILYKYFDLALNFYDYIKKEFLSEKKESTQKFTSPHFVHDYLEIKKAFKDENINNLNLDFENFEREKQYNTIERILNEYVRPQLFKDGGNLSLSFVDSNMMAINYLGNCQTCSYSLSTTMEFIQAVIRAELNNQNFLVVTDS